MAMVLSTQIQFFVPFLFVLAVTLGALSFAKVFNGAVRTVVALALALFAISYAPFVTVLWKWLPIITWFFIAMFMFAFILKLFGLHGGKTPKATGETLILGGVALLLLMSVGWMILRISPFEIPFIGSGDNVILLIGIIVISVLFLIASRIKGEKGEGG